MFDFRGKVALMAGGAGYLGVPVCDAFAERGARLMVADYNQESLDRLVEHLKSQYPETQLSGMTFDVGKPESITQAVDQTIEELGGLDILINSTYASVGKLVEELTAEEFDSSLHVNVTGSFLLAREACTRMNSGGNIIFYSSMYGYIAPDPRVYRQPLKPNSIEYGVAKAALEQMVRYLAVYWAPRKIRVNAIAPGPFPHTQVGKEHPEFVQALASKVPLGRIGRQNEVAAAAVFLASDEASYVTGQILRVDGGWTIW